MAWTVAQLRRWQALVTKVTKVSRKTFNSGTVGPVFRLSGHCAMEASKWLGEAFLREGAGPIQETKLKKTHRSVGVLQEVPLIKYFRSCFSQSPWCLNQPDGLRYTIDWEWLGGVTPSSISTFASPLKWSWKLGPSVCQKLLTERYFVQHKTSQFASRFPTFFQVWVPAIFARHPRTTRCWVWQRPGRRWVIPRRSTSAIAPTGVMHNIYRVDRVNKNNPFNLDFFHIFSISGVILSINNTCF